MTRIEIQQTLPPRKVLATTRATPRDLDARFAGGLDGSFAPSFEIREEAQRFVVRADVPGVAPTDLTIFIANDWVTVCGARTDDTKTAHYRVYERTFGSFWRAFRLQPGVVALGARAVLERGVLTLSVPKRTSFS
jgi:HSP20 family protein